MVRKFQERDLEPVLQIWLDSNVKAHDFIPESYWTGNLDMVRGMLPQAELYVYEGETGEILGFLGLMDAYIAGIFVRWDAQSNGIGKKLLDHGKKVKPRLNLHVYQKNRRAVSFYQREGFLIAGEGMDEETGELEFTMKWEKG